ncbi:MAG: ester cyclase [Bacteroidota bacterium]
MKKSTYLFPLLLLPFFFINCTSTTKLKQAETNRETIRLWFEEGWNHNRNFELIEAVFHPEWTDGNPLRPGQTIGHDGMKQLVTYYKEAFPDAQFTITHIFADDTHAAIRYEVEATHYGDAFGLKATGKKFTSTGLVLYEMRDGKIYRSWQELDLMGIINQLRE